MTGTIRLTTAQALIRFLKNQYVERDGKQNQFFAGAAGIFGHGNVAGIGEALFENPDFRYILVRNEQAAVHMAAGYAKMSNRLRTFACVSSIGPGATNMITGAALATVNRLPVLLLPGDIFARRNVAPVLQQLESSATQDISVNDCFKPVSRYWDRIYRPEQLITALPEVMRVLTSPADTGAVTLALPQDVHITITNRLSVAFYLYLKGPQNYSFNIAAGQTIEVYVASGVYYFVASASGFSDLVGNKEWSAGDYTWEFYVSS